MNTHKLYKEILKIGYESQFENATDENRDYLKGHMLSHVEYIEVFPKNMLDFGFIVDTDIIEFLKGYNFVVDNIHFNNSFIGSNVIFKNGGKK